MREVAPKTYLLAAPELRWDAMEVYLDEIGADSDVVLSRMGINDAEALVQFAGRFCYRSWEPGLNANVTKIREDSKEYLGNILASGHGSVLEHANFTFILQDVSRVLTHEMVRHRAGTAVSQESMRYVRLTDIPFWLPEWAQEDGPLMEEITQVLDRLEWFQRWMTVHFDLNNPDVPFSEKKHKTSFMRRFAPDGVATGMVVTFNVRALRHIIALRTSLGAEEEIRIVCDQIAEIALQEIPNLMQDYSPNEHREWIPEFLKV